MLEPRLVQLIPGPEGTFLALDDLGRVWQSGGIGSDRLSRPMLEWTPVRTFFHEPAPGDT